VVQVDICLLCCRLVSRRCHTISTRLDSRPVANGYLGGFPPTRLRGLARPHLMDNHELSSIIIQLSQQRPASPLPTHSIRTTEGEKDTPLTVGILFSLDRCFLMGDSICFPGVFDNSGPNPQSYIRAPEFDRLCLLLPNSEIDHLYKDRKSHGKVDILFWDMESEAICNQRHPNQ
jgi:hypothetical protein